MKETCRPILQIGSWGEIQFRHTGDMYADFANRLMGRNAISPYSQNAARTQNPMAYSISTPNARS